MDNMTAPVSAGMRPGRAALFLLVILALCLVFAGCGEGTKKEERQILRFYTWKPNHPEVWDEIVRTFEVEHPEVKVHREIGPHSSTSFHDLLTQKLKNRSKDLDVFLMDVVWPAEFAAAGWALPLDERFPESERSRYFANVIQANTYGGKIYGVPLYIDTGMLYYRRDLLERHGFKPPETWPEMVRQAGIITAAEPGMYGLSAQFKQYEGLVCNMLEYIMANRGHLIHPETGKSGLAERPAREAVQFVRERIIGRTAPAGVLAYEEPESLALFVQGKAVFHRNWPYAWETANDPARSRVAGKIGIAPLPRFPGGESHAALGGWQLGISRYSENKELAWTFIEFLSSPRIQKLLALKASLAPTRKDLYEDREILAACPQFGAMKRVFVSAAPRPVSPLYPALSNVMQRYFSRAVSGVAVDPEGESLAAAAEMARLLTLAP
ncbi:MAG: extracellular solute-binding protein [Pseudomonadota bacterium]|nr:extracellular solute-binding protein [Pseudomonadota bacterium]